MTCTLICFTMSRWQEERRKRYPTDSNVADRAAQASARRQRGELDPEGEARRLRLHEVIARQQELGLLKEAGTADLLWAASGRGGGLRGGRGRLGRHGGRGRLPLLSLCTMDALIGK